jgi:hypothetical protein
MYDVSDRNANIEYKNIFFYFCFWNYVTDELSSNRNIENIQWRLYRVNQVLPPARLTLLKN